MAHASKHFPAACASRSWLSLGTLLLLLALPLLLGACQNQSAQAKPEGSADSLAQSGDSSKPDSLAAGADSTAVDEKKGGFFARVFGKRGGDEKEKEEDEPIPVELAVAERKDVPLYLSATATLEAEKQADILAKISGEIRGIKAEEGDWVEEGRVLAVLDGDAQRVAVDEAEARVRAFELDFERVSSLHEMGLTSDKELHDARFRYEEAEARRQATRLQLDYTRIVAPFSGRITERFIDKGQTVAVGARIFSIADPDPLLARIHLPEKEAGRILPKQAVVMNPDADPSYTFQGEVLRVSPRVDPRTGTVKTTCQVAEPTALLRPGSFVRVRVRTDVHSGALVIPKRALVPEGGETYVFKAVQDTVIKIPVSTGYANGSVIEITAGLDVGDRVVTVGQGGLKTGSKFRELSEDTMSVAQEPEEDGSE